MTLSENDLIHLNRTGEQLKSAIRNLIAELPPTAQSIAGMAKYLDANKSTCQRLLNVMNKSQDGLDVILLVPGYEGINQFVDCMQAKGVNESLVEHARKASKTFIKDIKTFGRSHSSLKKILSRRHQSSQGGYSLSAAEQNRAAHFEASKQLLGESSQLTFATFVAQPNPRDDDYYQEFALVSRQGVNIKTQARPFMQFYSKDCLPSDSQSVTQSDGPPDVKEFALGMVDEFTSIDLREAYSGYSQATSSLVFANIKSDEQPFDATFLFNNPKDSFNPLSSKFKTTVHSISIKIPTERLVMLVFLEKSLDKRCSVNVGCYPNSLVMERQQHNYDEIWNDRFPEFPELKIVNSLTSVTELTAIDKSDEMIQYLFDYGKLDKEHFVCYMIDVKYPIWSSTYRVYFEFA